jgi:hypothetical protein
MDNFSVEENIFSKNTFRYKFTDEFMRYLFVFSKIHQYDHQKDFKEAWTIWTEENKCIIDEEIRRLTNVGYEGDILDKMYKSARYYFRKKTTEKKAPAKRRAYLGANKEFLEAIDIHIKNNINTDNYKPSNGFDDFCKSKTELLKDEVSRLYNGRLTDHVEIKNKLKKTYKNRYFLMVSNE